MKKEHSKLLNKTLVILGSTLYIFVVVSLVYSIVNSQIYNKLNDEEVYIIQEGDYIITKDEDTGEKFKFPIEKVDYDYEIVSGINYSDLPDDVETHPENFVITVAAGDYDENGNIIPRNAGYQYGDLDDPKLYNFKITDYKDEDDLKNKIFNVIHAELIKNATLGIYNGATSHDSLAIWNENVWGSDELAEIIKDEYNVDTSSLNDAQINYMKWQYIKDGYLDTDTYYYITNTSPIDIAQVYEQYDKIAKENGIDKTGEEYYNSLSSYDKWHYNQSVFYRITLDYLYDNYKKYN